MRRAARILLSLWLAGAMTLAQACAGPASSARDYGSGASRAGSNAAASSTRPSSAPGGAPNMNGMVVDKDASLALTAHFQRNRLPLVGAQVLRNPSTGQRAVVLYGYVATDRGKSDAQRQAEDYINDPEVDVENRVVVDPQLMASSGSGGPGTAGANNSTAGYYDPNSAQSANSTPGTQSYYDQQNQSAQIQQYQQYQQPSGQSINSIAPLIALLGILSAGMAASGPGGFGVGPGYPSPYGYSGAYPPYGGFPAPIAPMAPVAPMSPFGYGGSPFGFSGPFSTFP